MSIINCLSNPKENLLGDDERCRSFPANCHRFFSENALILASKNMLTSFLMQTVVSLPSHISHKSHGFCISNLTSFAFHVYKIYPKYKKEVCEIFTSNFLKILFQKKYAHVVEQIDLKVP